MDEHSQERPRKCPYSNSHAIRLLPSAESTDRRSLPDSHRCRYVSVNRRCFHTGALLATSVRRTNLKRPEILVELAEGNSEIRGPHLLSSSATEACRPEVACRRFDVRCFLAGRDSRPEANQSIFHLSGTERRFAASSSIRLVSSGV